MSNPPNLSQSFSLGLRLLFCAFCALLWQFSLVAAQSWSLSSPDSACIISVSLTATGSLTYAVNLGGNPVILSSPLGLRRDDASFERGLSLIQAAEPQTRRETYDLFSGPVPHVDHTLVHRQLTFANRNGARLVLELAAGNEGVAFRYAFPEQSSATRVVESELTGFTVPNGTRGWLQPYHAAGPYTPAYEDFYFHVKPGDPPPRSREAPRGWAFPALFEVPGAGWVLVTESSTDGSYCGCHLGSDSSGGLYRIAFAEADEKTKGQTNRFGPEPRFTLPWTMPWRVFVLGRSAGDIATATLVTDLAPPSSIADTSWIHPGRASWAWWSYPEGSATTELFNRFSDFGARMGWEYTLFDAGWWKPGLKPIASHALAKGIAPLAWCAASDFYDPARRNRKLDEVQSAGGRGVKVDFWCSDRQEAIAAMQALFADAAEKRMLVNLHGCTLPRGWQRTWPNFLTAEAVLGEESYMFEPQYTKKAAELDTVLPFTRNAVGPMDLTPIACAPKKYRRTTTAAHQLAAALVFSSGIVHYAESPEFFESLPAPVLQIFRDAPARWDETRCLVGRPGELVVFARRAGSSWFIAAISGSDAPLPVTLDLGAFVDFPRRFAVLEGAEPIMQVKVVSLSNASQWQHQLPPRGGVILRLER